MRNIPASGVFEDICFRTVVPYVTHVRRDMLRHQRREELKSRSENKSFDKYERVPIKDGGDTGFNLLFFSVG